MRARGAGTAAVTAAAAALLVGACTSSGVSTAPAKVPPGYLQLRFAAAGQPFATARITVGTKIAVRSLPGAQDPPGYPVSQAPWTVRAIQWSTAAPAPSGWYPFQAVGIGRADISEGYPCTVPACSAPVARIVLTVVPANA